MLEDGIAQILEKVYQKRGFDFRQYKETTLTRRIERRLKATKAASYQEYLAVLDADPTEYKKLLDDLTIKVTEFFRDPKAWEALGNQVLPGIIRLKRVTRWARDEGRGARDDASISSRSDRPSSLVLPPSLKIWSAGCATGEEAYSIAILLDEILGDRKDDFEISILGTDIDKNSLINAEKGVYKIEMVKKQIPEGILDMYCDLNGSARIKDVIKKRCHFKFHDLVSDEPFSEVDLILCRNVAIYFERQLQEKIFMDFYNGLNQNGYLFLGKAETLIGPAQEKFEVIDKHLKIYKKKKEEG